MGSRIWEVEEVGGKTAGVWGTFSFLPRFCLGVGGEQMGGFVQE